MIYRHFHLNFWRSFYLSNERWDSSWRSSRLLFGLCLFRNNVILKLINSKGQIPKDHSTLPISSSRKAAWDLDMARIRSQSRDGKVWGGSAIRVFNHAIDLQPTQSTLTCQLSLHESTSIAVINFPRHPSRFCPVSCLDGYTCSYVLHFTEPSINLC